jgi:hypothetical protein
MKLKLAISTFGEPGSSYYFFKKQPVKMDQNMKHELIKKSQELAVKNVV